MFAFAPVCSLRSHFHKFQNRFRNSWSQKSIKKERKKTFATYLLIITAREEQCHWEGTEKSFLPNTSSTLGLPASQRCLLASEWVSSISCDDSTISYPYQSSLVWKDEEIFFFSLSRIFAQPEKNVPFKAKLNMYFNEFLNFLHEQILMIN